MPLGLELGLLLVPDIGPLVLIDFGDQLDGGSSADGDGVSELGV